MSPHEAHPPAGEGATAFDLADLRTRVETELTAEITRQREVLLPLGADVVPLVDAVDDLLAAGKRLRAAFCDWGYRAFGGAHRDGILTLAAAMEMFQAAALIHDDVMDDSRTRRGRPTVHVRFGDVHAAHDWSGEPERYGLAGAILAGNLCLVWCDEMVARAALPAAELARARAVFDEMRTHLMAGQFLDMHVATAGWNDLDEAARIDRSRAVVRYKSAQYSVAHPLLIGARAAGVSDADAAHLREYGLALGEAFQFRDDVLGVFGDPQATGKPAGDDLREGKRTVLLALALGAEDTPGAQRLRERIGDPALTEDEIADLRTVIAESGAVERLEAFIDEDTSTARAHLDALGGITDAGRAALDALVEAATRRDA
ncbi:polyprenyl synthetase family protein [Mobilicoccus pelagius]|uniref:Putative polyprenyl diphosphate synthase n=1 Tax=Mobilicoccus pelagius NBRC 104925 TaxID=1089455 RepID=H5UUR7_9MICO|nr:polyprenyl synthetase family protein [Mobilicoccus pelagius]GAB49475.1 putative polyprenyl diphosphate synthase [Mobilicoccus pelagius NBRC 104925]